jgi:hypothetical protein
VVGREEAVNNLTRRDFFTFCKKDVLKDVFHAYQNCQAEVEKAEPKLSCEGAAIQLFGRKSGKSFLKKKVINK